MRKYFKLLLLLIIVVCACFAFISCQDNSLDSTGKNLTNYTIDISYDEATHIVSAVQVVDYINNTENSLTFIKFHIYVNAFRQGATINPVTSANASKTYPNGVSYSNFEMNSIKVDTTAVAYNIEGLDDNILNVPLSTELFPGERVSISMVYKITLPNSKHRLGYTSNTVNLGNFYPIACHYTEGGFLTDPYYSNGDPFITDMANYTVSVLAPVNYVVASSGDRQPSQDINSMTRHSFIGKVIRDFAIVMSTKFNKLSQTVGDTTVEYYFYSDRTPNDSLIAAADSIKTFSNMIATYPYKTYTVVETDFCYAGMEYPMLSMIASGQTKVNQETAIIHETAHQWWYGLVGNDQIRNSWMDEGLAEYYTMNFYRVNTEYNINAKVEMTKSYKSYALYIDVLTNYANAIDISFRQSNLYRSENEYILMSYLKGMLLFDSLKQTLGEEKFDRAIKKYYSEGKLKINSVEQMISSFERGSGIKLENFFNTWITGKEVLTVN